MLAISACFAGVKSSDITPYTAIGFLKRRRKSLHYLEYGNIISTSFCLWMDRAKMAWDKAGSIQFVRYTKRRVRNRELCILFALRTKKGLQLACLQFVW
jgi:hypothetical protein